jgi:transketolase
MLSTEKKGELNNIALKVREHIVNMSTNGGCFTGASLSCADILVYLYHDYLNIGPHNFKDPEIEIICFYPKVMMFRHSTACL